MTDTTTTWAFVLGLVGAVLGAASLILHAVAPRTKTTWDDRAAVLVDKIIAEVKKIGGPLVLLLVVVALAASSAACGASAREKTLQATLVSANAARDAFVAYDAAHQNALIDESKDKPAAVAALTSYRNEQTKVELLFGGLYRTVAAAAVLDADPNLAGVEEAAALLMLELRTLGVIK